MTDYPAADASWSSASSGQVTITHMMIGDDVFALVDGEWIRVGEGGWHLHIGPEGGELVAGPPPKEENDD